MAAYWIADGETLRSAGLTVGFYLYAFYEHGSCGYWNVAAHPAELLAAMQQYKSAVDPSRPLLEREPPTDCPPPPSDPAQIRPTFNRDPAHELRRTAIPHLDVSGRMGTTERRASVTPIRPARNT